MAGIIDGVDQRTQLAGHNRLELLLFRLEGQQLYGINVFKVREAVPCPALTKLPNAHPVICGISNVRGKTVSIYDLSKGIGGRAVKEPQQCFVIITEYNRSIQGFLIRSVDRIVNTSWSEIMPPPAASGKKHYVTAITEIDNQLIEIIDVEKVLAEVVGINDTVSQSIVEQFTSLNLNKQFHILVADDSSVARNQIRRTMEQLGIKVTIVNDGLKALRQLQAWAAEGLDVTQHIDLLISDIEMPEMDGYTLTTEIRKDPAIKDVRILLHTSMSGAFNNALVEKVGADKFIPKFSPDDLALTVQELLTSWHGRS